MSRSRKVYGIFALLILLIPYPLQTLGNRYYVSVLVVVGVYSLISMGLSLLMGYAGQISLGHAAFYGIGAYTSGLLAVKWHVSPWLGLIAAIALAGAIAWIIGIPVLKLKGHYLAMATLGFGEIVYVILSQFSWMTGDTSGLPDVPPFRLGSFEFYQPIAQYYLVWPVSLLVLLGALNLVDSRVGRALRAIHGNEMAASVVGVNVTHYKVLIFMLSAMFAGAAGAFYAHFEQFVGYTSFGLMFSIRFVMMVVIGGMHSLWGAVLGAFVITVLPEVLRAVEDYEMIIYGLILMVIMIFSPRGLLGSLSALEGRFRTRFRTASTEDDV